MRIYFSQIHESFALKIYFGLHQKFAGLLSSAKSLNQKTGQSLLIMIYPNAESFKFSFEGSQEFLVQKNLIEDTVIGINGPFEDPKLSEILSKVEVELTHWQNLLASQGPANSSQFSARDV